MYIISKYNIDTMHNIISNKDTKLRCKNKKKI